VSTGNIRRGQLVTPFGVGAMSVLVNGTSVITAGLDHWYETDGRTQLDMSEYTANDWRLEARLRVQEFRLPPDFRASAGVGPNTNVKLTVPVLRFPRWSFCMYCKRLERSTLTMRQPVLCPDPKCAERKRRARMSQVPFVAICARGHLDDFPFDKWVHHSHHPTCAGPLRLESRGGGSLGGQVIVCESCHRERSLLGITDSRRDRSGQERTTLTDRLAEDDPYFCEGAAPWLVREGGVCGEPIRGALRAAGNVYFPKVESSIYLPKKLGAVSAEMHEILRRPTVSPVLKLLRTTGQPVTGQRIREVLAHVHELLAPFSDDELLAGYEDLFGVGERPPSNVDDEHAEILTGDAEWRFPEYQLLRETPKDDYLTATDPTLPDDLTSHLDRVRSVEVLRETRALRGFTRVRDGALRLSDGKALLRRTWLPPERDWLPAYVVKGEGIYLELEAGMLANWERNREVIARANLIATRYGDVARLRGLENRNLSPRFVLIHTLAHLLINELVFNCGYSSASLRERLYVSEEVPSRMAGVLIYTAAGDSEGTMGGLVRMARPENLRSVFADAINDARWCSTDPVCMDAGERGQGPDSCNLAACHGCALLPETSCEEFNRFLDRGLVIGTFGDPSIGYFSTLSL
jgi:hypothetical protein